MDILRDASHKVGDLVLLKTFNPSNCWKLRDGVYIQIVVSLRNADVMVNPTLFLSYDGNSHKTEYDVAMKLGNGFDPEVTLEGGLPFSSLLRDQVVDLQSFWEKNEICVTDDSTIEGMFDRLLSTIIANKVVASIDGPKTVDDDFEITLEVENRRSFGLIKQNVGHHFFFRTTTDTD